LKYIPKVFLKFKLPDGSTREGFFHQSQGLRGIIGNFGVKGRAFLIGEPCWGVIPRRAELDQSRNIGQLGLKNDDVIGVK